jgi:hypothetical protein
MEKSPLKEVARLTPTKYRQKKNEKKICQIRKNIIYKDE